MKTSGFLNNLKLPDASKLDSKVFILHFPNFLRIFLDQQFKKEDMMRERQDKGKDIE